MPTSAAVASFREVLYNTVMNNYSNGAGAVTATTDATARRPLTVEIYSDIACPWCYIGERRLQRALAALPATVSIEVVFRPFQLDPAAPATATPLVQYLERRYGTRASAMLSAVSRTAADEGIAMDWDRALAVNTRTAHRLLQWALREGGAEAQRRLAGELFALHFEHGGDVADLDQLATAASAAGLDASRARDYLASDEGTAEIDEAFDAARRLGITAVPTFVIDGRYAVQGAQPASDLVRVLEQVLSTPRPSEAPGGDACVDGVCAT